MNLMTQNERIDRIRSDHWIAFDRATIVYDWADKANDLGRRFEVAERISLCHPKRALRHPARLNQVSSDNAPMTHF